MSTSPYAASAEAYDTGRGAGWVTFASVMLAIAGAFNVFNGILAVSKSKFYTDNAVYVFSDLNTWGWIVMGLGALQLLAAFTLMGGSEFARWFGIFVAGLNAVGQLMFVPAYPFWALSLFAVDILIIYALAVYAGHRLNEI
ncbi:MAG TPA: hypothetical protein VFL41_05630 [Gaiellaceae bacterium]|nr:hypothetical protein [Gaiellaceae bacterium]